MEAHTDASGRLVVGHEDIFHAVGELAVGYFCIGCDVAGILCPRSRGVCGWRFSDVFRCRERREGRCQQERCDEVVGKFHVGCDCDFLALPAKGIVFFIVDDAQMFIILTNLGCGDALSPHSMMISVTLTL